MKSLVERIRDRIRWSEGRERAKGNVDNYNVNFSGRTTEMRLLRESAALKQVGVLTAVQGLGGIGKTALACAYAHVYAAEYPGGCWQLKCEGRGDLRAALISLAGARDFEFEFTDEERRDLDLGFERVLRELKKRAEAADPPRVLLILDNVDKPELLAPAQTARLPSADWLHLIATTRLGEAELGRAPDRCFVPMNELPDKDAVDLIERWQPEGSFPNEEERRAAHALVRLLGGFTLAVEAAAVYLGQNAGEVTCAGFTARLEKEGLDGLDEAVGDPAVRLRHGEKRLSATLQPTLDQLISSPEEVALTVAALLPADFVVLPWIRSLAASEFSELGRVAEPGYPDPWQNLLNRLISLRLFLQTAESNVVRVHRLVQELVRQRTEAPRLEALEIALMSEVEKRGEAVRDDWINPQARWELKPLAACAEHWMGMQRREAEGAGIANYSALPMVRLARFSEAEPLLRRALAIGEKHFGSENYGVAMLLNNLASLLSQTNRLAEAEPLYRRALAVQEKCLGPDHPDVAIDLNNLAGLLVDTRRLAEAEPLYRRSLALLEKNFGPDYPDVAHPLDNLASLLRDTGRLAEAEPLYRRALALREKGLGPDHPEVAISLNNVATLLNPPSEAEPLYRRALAIWEKSLGPDHPQVAASLNNLAALLKDTDRLAEAEQLCRRAKDIEEKSLGPDHPLVARSLDNLAYLLNKTNRPAEAEPLYRRALAIREKSFGPDDPSVGDSLNRLANLLKDANRTAEAEPLYRRALGIQEKIRPRDPPGVAASSDQKPPPLVDPKQPETEARYRRALSDLEKSRGPRHPDLIPPLNNLANLLAEAKRPAEAEPLYRRALALREGKFGASDPGVAPLLNNLAVALSNSNRMADAEPLVRRALAIREKSLGPDDLEVAVSLNFLANLLTEMGRLTEVEPLCRRMLAIQEKHFGPDDPSVAQALLNLIVVLRELDRIPEAEPLDRRALAIRAKNLKLGKPEVAPIGNRPGAELKKTSWLKKLLKG